MKMKRGEFLILIKSNKECKLYMNVIQLNAYVRVLISFYMEDIYMLKNYIPD